MTWLDEKMQVTLEKKTLVSDIFSLTIKVIEEKSINN